MTSDEFHLSEQRGKESIKRVQTFSFVVLQIVYPIDTKGSCVVAKGRDTGCVTRFPGLSSRRGPHGGHEVR